MHARYYKNICLDIYVGEDIEFQRELKNPTFIFDPFSKKHYVKSLRGSYEFPEEVEHALDEVAFRISVVHLSLKADTRDVNEKSKALLLNELACKSGVNSYVEKTIRENWLEQIYECVPLDQRQKSGYCYAFVNASISLDVVEFIVRMQICFYTHKTLPFRLDDAMLVPVSYCINEKSREL